MGLERAEGAAGGDEEDGKRGERPHLGPAVEVLAGGMLRWMPQN